MVFLRFSYGFRICPVKPSLEKLAQQLGVSGDFPALCANVARRRLETIFGEICGWRSSCAFRKNRRSRISLSSSISTLE